jgi:hypothetical protein
MTRRDTLQCVHEPFGDAYYFGPERLAERYEGDEQARKESGYSQSTYRTIFDRIAKDNSEVRTSHVSKLSARFLYWTWHPSWPVNQHRMRCPVSPRLWHSAVACSLSYPQGLTISCGFIAQAGTHLIRLLPRWMHLFLLHVISVFDYGIRLANQL